MRKKLGYLLIVLTLIIVIVLCSTACSADKGAVSSVDGNVEQTLPTIKVESSEVRSADKHPTGSAKVVEKLSLSPLTDSPSFTVKGAVNYKWIAYDNYTVAEHFEKGTMLAEGGYLIYLELPKADFGHEMYFEFFAENDKVDVYSGEVAYTESDKKWYSLALGDEGWSEHTTEKYKLCFDDGGEEFRGYVFIPADSLTYRNEQKTLTDIGIYVKTGVETCNGDIGDGMDFTVSAVLTVSYFDKTTTVAESDKGRVDLSENKIIE